MKKQIFSGLLCAIAMVIWLSSCKSDTQTGIQPGFNAAELATLLPAMERTYDSSDIGGFKTPEPVNLKRVFRSSVSPLMNRFDVWTTSDRKAVVTIRGTIVDTAGLSFALNFYCRMVPAAGSVNLGTKGIFNYKLAALPGAGVHAGFVLGLGFMSEELFSQVENQYKEGIRDVVILGHSQGSGLAYVVTSWLRYLQLDGKLPSDLRFKTYCIAAPKSGNLLFAYDYEKITGEGYSYSVNNVIDWVPSIAMTFQSVSDFPNVSPFRDLKGFLTYAGFPPGPGFDKGFEAFSGAAPGVVAQLSQVIHQSIYPKILRAVPGFVEPEFIESFDYQRIGTGISLVPDSAYYKLFPNDPARFQVWENHSVYPYYVLVTAIHD